MVSTIYISADVIQNSMLDTGDAIAAFTSWKPKRRENVFRYEKADIRITAANGSIYLMSEAETKKPKIPFTPVPAAELGKLVRSMSGAAQ
ncbi:MAG: hypothetical protein M9955_26420 [Rhizobiaceae bacterium]|uniref:hypothetical protein n=1 Tax=unclassified Shinella TaxID=2643062 RepID=UPI00234E7203|nr:hypothetical protein [Shinella sp. YE25]MCO5085183.1 hypothetical protein [Rhizobiaceae bacterium]MDC7255742.1 hypothetical protein [Shinella sp. YE25]